MNSIINTNLSQAYQVHEKVEFYGDIDYEEDGGEVGGGVGRHHNIGVVGGCEQHEKAYKTFLER